MHEVTIVGYKSYVTSEGEAFDSIALQEYDEEKMAHYIIKENPDYCDVLTFEAGVVLHIPILETTNIPDTLPPWRR